MRAVLSLLAAGAADAPPPGDVGYERMFEDSLQELEWQCWASPQLGGGVPGWLEGSFILPTVAQFAYGGRAFQGVLDGFGKLHRFQIKGGEVCARAKMMRTGFYNQSRATGTVAPGVLFMETDPPRSSCHLPLCNARGPNDNTYVNTIKMGDQFSTWTDSPKLNVIDPIRLEVNGLWQWTDKVSTRIAHLAALGSAHPIRRNGTGDWVALVIDAPLVDHLQGAFVDVVTISDADPHTRTLLYSTPRLPNTPYFHSYGVTEDYVVLPFTPMAFEMLPLVENKPMTDCFHQQKTDGELQTKFAVIPFDGSAPLYFEPDHAFTYGHVVNSFQNESGIVFDACAYQSAKLYLTADAGKLSVQRTKALRDALSGGAQRTHRYVLHTRGPLQGTVTDEPLGIEGRIQEFPKINMRYSTRQHCTYYVAESFHNDRDFASTAIAKHNVCTGKRQAWYRPSTYPSEPFFVQQPGGGEEDGVVMFGATDGLTNTSSFVIADAASLETLAEVPLPFVLTFTTHGEWFEGMVAAPDSRAPREPIFI